MAELKRSMGFWTILALAISSIAGTGLFYGTGIASKYAGNASILSWVLLSLFALYVSSCFGELTSMFPEAGGVYEFCKQSYGRFFSFIIGWTAWLVGNITIPLTVVAAVNTIFPADPSYIVYKIAMAVAIILLLNFVAFLGVDASAAVLIILALITFGSVLAVVIPGLGAVHFSNFVPFFNFGFAGVFVAIFFISESFFGWESVTYLSEETNEPEKVIPKSLIYGTIMVGILVILVSIVSLGAIPWETLVNSQSPFLDVASKLYNPQIVELLSFGIFAALINAAFGGIISMPRLLLALARDKLFLSHFTRIHKVTNTPYKAIIFQTFVSLLILAMGFGNYKLLLNLLLPLGFVMYIFVILAVPILRRKLPEKKRPFKVPFGTAGPILTILFILTLFILWLNNEPTSWSIMKFGLSLVMFGFPLYFLISLYYDPRMITEANDITAYFTLFTERLSLPHKVREEILSLLGNVRSKSVLEYGCSVGTLTVMLSKQVGPNGKVYAIDLSKNDLKITQKRIEQDIWDSKEREHARVTIIHDEKQVLRLHPSITYADAIVSVGMLGYMQDIEKILKEFYKILPNEGKICFVEYGDFFKLIPNVEWLSKNEVVEQVFRNAGFSVRVLRKKGLFWNYIYVYGYKSREQVTII